MPATLTAILAAIGRFFLGILDRAAWRELGASQARARQAEASGKALALDAAVDAAGDVDRDRLRQRLLGADPDAAAGRILPAAADDKTDPGGADA